jgi:hypothetical protein
MCYNNNMSRASLIHGNVAREHLDILGKKLASEKQVGGNHYKQYAIQPIDFIEANNIPYIEGNVIKYLLRWRDKNGVEDLDKAIHYIELLKGIEAFKNEES